MAQIIFQDRKELYLAIDDKLIKKVFSQMMLCVIGVVTDGKDHISIGFDYLFASELIPMMPQKPGNKKEIAKSLIRLTLSLFPNAQIIVTTESIRPKSRRMAKTIAVQ